jgi:hypothetical protein
MAPSPNGHNGAIAKGRGPNGRFAPGWRGGPGNPLSAKVGRIRSALLQAITPQDVSEVVAAFITEAKSGAVSGVMAARELFDRTLGKAAPPASDDAGDASGLSVEAQGVKLLLGMGLPYEHWPEPLLALWRSGRIPDAPRPPGWVESREVSQR